MHLDYQHATNKIVGEEVLKKLRCFKNAMIFGGGESGNWVRCLIEKQGISSKCYIDNYIPKQGTEKDGLKILSLEKAVELYGEEACICIGSLWADEILDQIAHYDTTLLNKTFNFKGAMVWEIKEKIFASTEITHIINNVDKYDNLYEKLADDESRYVLEGILNYRITRDYIYLQKIVSDEMEYIDQNIIPLHLMESGNCEIIDGGAFDGDSIEMFSKTFDMNKVTVHCYEPLHTNAERIRSKIKDLSFARIVVHEAGLYKTGGRNGFIGDGLGGTIQNTKNESEGISLECIDDVAWNNLRFVKLDIEGAERDALCGGRKSIERHNPILAICAYHRQDDMLALSNFIFSLRHYKVYLRHYLNATSETIMYGIPCGLN